MTDVNSNIVADLAPLIKHPDAQAQPPWPPAPFDTLSRRQIETARLLALGQNHYEIADRMGVQVQSVDGYRQGLMRKLGLKNNVTLARLALKVGLVTLEDAL